MMSLKEISAWLTTIAVVMCLIFAGLIGCAAALKIAKFVIFALHLNAWD